MLKRILIAIVFAMIPLIGISHAFTLTINSYNYYNGYYWGNPNQYSTSSSSGWSSGVYTTSYSASASLELTSPLTWNWGDGSQSTFNIDTGLTYLNAYTGSYTVDGVSYSNFNNCEVSPEYQSSANGYAQTMFNAYVTSGGSCLLQETHDYTSTGIYSVYLTGASSTAGSYQSNTISIAIISISTPSAPTSSITTYADAGSTLSLSGSFTCGSNTICPNVYLYSNSTFGYSSITSLTNPSSPGTITASINYNPNQYQITTQIYNPIPPTSTVVGSPLNIEIFPDLSTPTLSVSQSPSASNGLVAREPITLTITVPQQNNGIATENAPSGTINWGDNTATSIAGSSFSKSGSNYVATFQHTYSSPSGSSPYSISVSLQSYNYVTYGSPYGSTAGCMDL